jgi:hypothetical protein
MSPFTSDEQRPIADERLRDAYLATDYFFEGFTLNIGHRHPEFDAWLTSHGLSNYAFLTPYNPYSRPRLEAENHRSLRQLLDVLHTSHIPFGPAEARDPSGDWPAEAGVFLLNVPPGVVHQFGRHFQQFAVVEGKVGGVPMLVWV